MTFHDVHHPLVRLLPPAAGASWTARASPTTSSTSSSTPTPPTIVESANGGNQTVPTLVFADGTAQTNPSLRQVKEKLDSSSPDRTR